ncbi:hypothetical protein Cob_v009657 [Colletotrichum orbiculare MAFF 240422]|uniref:Uncharacterized protein n=1 Tax=Colletotrichum orbiculare (strain 104-T / ATCC 96160 / CBS 514.97 / LARS 414 / MAFF 240422) TaxID=1213857 RepID=A0A484FJJ1_COLOR|nr:hypothetical protein Cob_v009657 [Colletotrichum orbiculare MAFF 240422]
MRTTVQEPERSVTLFQKHLHRILDPVRTTDQNEALTKTSKKVNPPSTHTPGRYLGAAVVVFPITKEDFINFSPPRLRLRRPVHSLPLLSTRIKQGKEHQRNP